MVSHNATVYVTLTKIDFEMMELCFVTCSANEIKKSKRWQNSTAYSVFSVSSYNTTIQVIHE